jgi:trehalose/maltose hydrolase-like predicted phosphorylase
LPPEGIHLQAMAGTVDIVLRCLTGMRALGPVIRFEPALPPAVKQLRFSVHYRGHRIDVDLAEDRIRLSVRPGGVGPVNLLVHGHAVELAPGQQRELQLERA